MFPHSKSYFVMSSRHRGGRRTASELNSYFGYTGKRENEAAITIQWCVREHHKVPEIHNPSSPYGALTRASQPLPVTQSMVRSVNAIMHAEALWEEAMVGLFRIESIRPPTDPRPPHRSSHSRASVCVSVRVPHLATFALGSSLTHLLIASSPIYVAVRV